jgi:hypothetical protein
MRRRRVLAAVGLAVAPGAMARAQGVEALRWRKRVVLVFAPPGDPRVQGQREALARLGTKGDDRDLQLVSVEGGRVEPPLEDARALRRRYRVQRQAFVVVLIGKDGGVKLRQADVLSADQLARTVDAMPMRRSEMAARLPR